MCPDMTFALGNLTRPERSRQAIFWLSRTDGEASGYAFPECQEGVDRTDWVEDTPPIHFLREKLLTLQLSYPGAIRRLWNFFPDIFDGFARQRMRRGCRMLSRGRVVIADRLHGHILSLLMGIPHVLLDDNYGKLKSFYETWTAASGLAVWADSAAAALAVATSLAES